MNWYHIHLNQDQIAALVNVKILSAFQELFHLNGKPYKAWLLTDRVYSNGTFQHSPDLNYYFSPEASQIVPALLETYHAKECDAPDFTKIVPAAGDNPSFWTHSGASKSPE